SYYLLLVFSSSAVPRVLHSFPTRRSSDLASRKFLRLAQAFWPGGLTLVVNAAQRIPLKVTAGTGRIGLRWPNSTVVRRLIDEFRSEEHTSELQSPCNLVCRLVLEKKKEDD